jgi:mono/diheme cytochrome c family protein
MNANTRVIMAIAAGAVIGLFLLAGIFILLNFSGYLGTTSSRGFRSPMMGPSNQPLQRYSSNGERIYFTGTSDSGDSIRADRRGMGGMMSGGMACVNCHGTDGRGGTLRMMMGTFTAPDIRYATLTGEEHEEGEEEHPPYTDETIKRAITEGIDPAGESLEWPMPRWEISESDLNDLLDYLKTLK